MAWLLLAAILSPFGPSPAETAMATIALVLLFVIPGHLILALAGPGPSRLERAVLSVPVGLLALGTSYYLYDLHWAARPGAPSLRAFVSGWAGAFLVASLARAIVRRRRGASPGIRLAGRLVSIGLVTLAVFPILSRSVFLNGQITDKGILFVLDDFSHFSLMGEFLRPGPTLAPYLAGWPFPPQNLLNAALCGAVLSVARLDPVHLFFLYLPALYFGWTVLAGYVAFRRLSRSHAIGLLAAFLFFYSGDYAFSLGMADEPHNGLAEVLFLGGLGLLAIARGGRSQRLALLAGAVFGGLFQAKAPAFVTVGAALGIAGGVDWLRTRRAETLMSALGAGLFALPSALPFLGETQHGALRFSPGGTFLEYLSAWTAEVKALAPLGSFLGSHAWLAFVASVLVLLLVLVNLRLLCVPMVYRRIRARRALTDLDGLLACLFLVGLLLALTIRNPDARLSSVPFWFFTFTGLPVATLLVAWALHDWVRGTSRRRAVLGLCLFFLPAVLVGIGASTGEDERKGHSPAVYRMAVWLRESTGPTDVVLQDPEATGLCWLSLRPSVLTFQPVLLGEGDPVTAGEEYRRSLFEEVKRRRLDIERFFSTVDPEEARRILERYGVRFVAVLPERPFHFSPPGVLEEEYADHSGGKVFRVVPAGGPPRGDGGPRPQPVAGGEPG